MSQLYLVPTPIGNLSDITFRAVEILKEVDLILAEDTRTSSKLLGHYQIKKPLKAYHQHNEHKMVASVIEQLKSGASIAIITDAGTPGISDPGFLLARECIKEGIKIESLPGASALTTALVGSGLPSDRFFFEGFLPHKKGRKTRLEFIAQIPHTVVLFESPHRLNRTLEDLQSFFGKDTYICVARELTKKFEEYKRGTIEDVFKYYSSHPAKGEIVIIVDRKQEK